MSILNYKKRLLIVVLLFCNHFLATGQLLEFQSIEKVVLDKKIIPYKSAEHFFINNIETHRYYEKSRSQIKAGKILGYSTVAGLVIGVAVPLSSGHSGYCDTFCLTTGDIIGLITLFLVVPPLGTTALLIHSAGKRNMKRAIQSYNQSVLNKGTSLALGTTKNGIGFTLTF